VSTECCSEKSQCSDLLAELRVGAGAPLLELADMGLEAPYRLADRRDERSDGLLPPVGVAAGGLLEERAH
jgi:hypothetical protein